MFPVTYTLPRDLYANALYVKRNAGRLKLLDRTTKDLTKRLCDLPVADDAFPDLLLVTPSSRSLRRVRRRTVAGGSFRTLDHDGLRTAYPQLYARSVRSVEPNKRFSLYFGQRDALWQRAATDGHEDERARWEMRCAFTDWNNPAEVSRILFELREAKRAAEQRDERLRMDLSADLEYVGLRERTELRSPDQAAKIDARLSRDRQEIDWALLESRPEAHPFIGSRPVAGYTTIVFEEDVPAFDPEGDAEPFEGE